MSEMLLPRKSFGGGNMKLSTVQVCDFIRSRSARFCFKQASTSHLHHQSGGDQHMPFFGCKPLRLLRKIVETISRAGARSRW